MRESKSASSWRVKCPIVWGEVSAVDNIQVKHTNERSLSLSGLLRLTAAGDNRTKGESNYSARRVYRIDQQFLLFSSQLNRQCRRPVIQCVRGVDEGGVMLVS